MRVVEPRTAFKVTVTLEHIERAKPADPCFCVMAQALTDSGGVISAEVNATITTVIRRGRCERYQTPRSIREGLKRFDQSGQWDLPVGEYIFPPVAASQTKRAQRKAAQVRRALGDPNMFHDRSKYPRRKQNLSARALHHRQLMQLEKVA